jgi:hypothetical protein
MFGILQEFVRGTLSFMFGILREFVRGTFNYHLRSEFNCNLLEGRLITIYVRHFKGILRGKFTYHLCF